MPKSSIIYEYTEHDVRAALDAVREKKLTLNAASKLFKVPRSTLIFRNSPSFTKTTKGPASALSPEEEQTFADWILDCYKRGFPRSSLELCLSVKIYLKQMKRPNTFVNSLPGINWLKSFRKRHPEILQPRRDVSYRATEQDIRSWFGSVEAILQERKVSDVLTCPDRVFRGEITTFALDSQQKQVITAVKEGANGMDSDVKEAEEIVTAMVTFSANGAMLPPMLVYPNQKIPSDIANGIPNTWFVKKSECGFISADVFYEYIINAFNLIDACNIKGPVILFVDGYGVRLTQQISQLCDDLQIILISMYPDSTRLVQESDLALLTPIKSGWEIEAAQWKRNNPTEMLTKKHIAPVLAEFLKKGTFVSPCIDGFKAAGVCPWNVDSIDFSKCPSTQNGQDGSDVENKNVLTFDRFCSIVGEGTVEMCRTLQQRGITDEENLFYRLWLEFQKPLVKQAPAVSSLGQQPDRQKKKL